MRDLLDFLMELQKPSPCGERLLEEAITQKGEWLT
jgi:hypothetical protein